jgi:hypothetical protein
VFCLKMVYIFILSPLIKGLFFFALRLHFLLCLSSNPHAWTYSFCSTIVWWGQNVQKTSRFQDQGYPRSHRASVDSLVFWEHCQTSLTSRKRKQALTMLNEH